MDMSLIAAAKPPVLPASPSVLIVEDESAVLEMVEEAVRRDLNCRPLTCGSIRAARRILATQRIDLLIVDVGLPDGDRSPRIA